MKAATLLILLALATSAQAAEQKDWRKFCARYASIAEVIMKNRQVGTSMQDLLKASDTNESTKALSTALIIDAYGRKKHYSDGMKQRAIDTFRDDMHLECINLLRKEDD